MTKLSSGWNLPPGVFERDLPGANDAECGFCGATCDSRFGCDCAEAQDAREAAEAAALDAKLDDRDDDQDLLPFWESR